MNDRAGVSNHAHSVKVFFSFRYDEDRYRADVVCAAWRAHRTPGVAAYVDSRVSEPATALADDEIKQAIRDGVDQTSVTCVLIGAHTWKDRWVRYEIARSVERGNGLLGVRIDGIADPKTQQRVVASWNPLAYLGIGKIKSGVYLLFENSNGQWSRYEDDPMTLRKPTYVPDMSIGYIEPLSVGLSEYDYVAQNGAENLDQWIAQAAAKAGK
jgi:hypothetical protein